MDGIGRVLGIIAASFLGGACNRGAVPEEQVDPTQADAPVAPAPSDEVPASTEPVPAGTGYAVCAPDGFEEVAREKLPPGAADTRWFVHLDPSPEYSGNIGIFPLEGAPPEMYETMANLQKASAGDAEALCQVFLAGVGMGASSANASGGGVIEVSWGRTCQAELVRTDKEGLRSKLTVMRAGPTFMMVLSVFSEGDAATPKAHEQLIGCWTEVH